MSPLEDLPLGVLAQAIQVLSSESLKGVTFGQLCQFWRFALRLKREIDLATSSTLAPLRLPQYVHEFLRDSVGLNDIGAIELWDFLKPHIWDMDVCPELTADEVALFLHYGKHNAPNKGERIGMSMHSLYPGSET